MNKQIKLVFYGLITLVAILAASNGYFYAKSINSATKNGSTDGSSISKTPEASKSSVPTPQTSSPVAKLASSNERPSNPSDTYTIARGDSLFSIAEKNGLTLLELSSANGIIDNNKILFDQILIIPKNNQINFTIQNDNAATLQKYVDNGKIQWRLSPEETARSDNAGSYGFTTADTFTLKEKNINEGTASVIGVVEGKSYLIKLIQPGNKNDKSIWVIVSIAPVTQ